MCVWCDAAPNISPILLPDIWASFIPIIGWYCIVCLQHAKPKHCGCCCYYALFAAFVYLFIGCSSKYRVRSCGTMLALTVCILAFDPCQNVEVLLLLCSSFDSSLVTHLSAIVTNALFDAVLTWQHHHHRHAVATSSHMHWHAAAAPTFSAISCFLLINSLPCSVCFFSKASHSLPWLSAAAAVKGNSIPQSKLR